MAAPRKRPSSGFTQKEESDTPEEKAISELLEVAAAEIFETLEKEEETFPEMIPTEDPGPRFLDEPVEEEVKILPQQLKKPPTPTRHPRNVPKFSRYK